MKPIYLVSSAVAIMAVGALNYAARATASPVPGGASSTERAVSDARLA